MLNTTPERSSKETFVTTFRRKTRRKRAILTSDSSATFCLFRITTRAKPVSETSKRNDQNIRLVSYSKQKAGDSTMPPNTMASSSKSSKVVMQLSPLAFQMENFGRLRGTRFSASFATDNNLLHLPFAGIPGLNDQFLN